MFDDVDKLYEVGYDIEKEMWEKIKETYNEGGHDDIYYFSSSSVWDSRSAVIGMYGTFLFLGIILGLVFLFATALIIYYKQISEGYEDRERFQIMQKIGMSSSEVKKTINTQVLFVFFLPLLIAGIHLLFAYPLLEKLLKLLLLPDKSIFTVCALITYAVFSVIYVLIYIRTSKTYYKIVH